MSNLESSADVVVIGAGPAGMAAASSAALAGASVMVLESGSSIGGNAVRSNGYCAFVGADATAQSAFVEDARTAYRGAAARYGLVWDEAAVRQFAAQSATTYRALIARGVQFSRTVTRPEHSVDRILAVTDAAMFGRAYAADFTGPGIGTEFGVRADRLLVDGGRVVGVRAHRLDGDSALTVRARRAVVLATGGYQAGHLLRARLQPPAEALSPYYGTSDCRGDGHLMGSAIGGDLVNMTYLPPTVLAPSTVVENAIAINSTGVRFHDEMGTFADRVDALRGQPGRRAWYVLDADVAREHEHLIAQMPQPPVSADDVTELARLLGVPVERLTATIEGWRPQCRRPSGSRLVAIPMVEGVNISCGGFRTTPRMQVIDVLGSAIPGLFAAGDTTAGLNAAAGMIGLHISGAFTQGRIAGLAAAAARNDTADYGSLLRTDSPIVAAAEDLTALGHAYRLLS